MAFEAGASVGPYRIVSPLGAGGMGEVYRARDSRLGRDVALKVLPESLAADAERIARFEREAQILAALSHANIAAIYGLELSGAVRVLVIELIEGESLEARLRRGPLPLDEALAIARQIGDALSAAHDRAIVHRDLKPGNIMLTPDGGVKVLDFGLARMVEPDSSPSGLSMSPTLSIQATLAGTILGTAPYMSPEQARGRAVDKRTDVWAFGCVLFEMLTGKRAFDGDDVTETIATIVKGEPDWAALEASAPPNIVRVVRGCLTKDPRQRFADIAVPQFLLTGAHAAPAAPMVTAASPRPLWTRALPATVAAVAAAVLAGAAVWALRPALPPADLVRFSIPLPAGQGVTTTGRRALALSPDGRQLAYVANTRLFIRAMADAEPHMIPGSDMFRGTVNAVSFSPNGQELAFYTAEDLAIRRIATAGGTPVTVARPGANPTGLTWEPEGLLFALPGKGIFRVSPDGGTPTQLVTTAEDEIAGTPESLPEGRGILYSVRKNNESWDQGTVMVQRPDGQRQVLVRGGSDGRYDGHGHLLYALSGVVMAVPFDLDRLAVTGGAVPAIEGVLRSLGGVNSGIAQYTVASNGTLAYIPGPVKASAEVGDRLLAIFDDKGGIERLDVPPGTYQAPRASPDGKTIVFETITGDDANIAIKEVASGIAIRRLTFGGHNRAPVWSPDGQWIAFQSDREGDLAVYRQRADGSGTAERLTAKDPAVKYTPQSWSPDGATLLVSAQSGDGWELRLVSLKDHAISRYSNVTSAIPTEAAFSPDGKWVVYQAARQIVPSSIEGYLEPYPATGAKYLVPPRAGHPQWSRTGDRLYFNNSATSSKVVDVRTSPTVAFSAPRDFPRARRAEPDPAAQRRWADMLPDGRMLGITNDITNTTDANAPEQFVVILNWQQTLDARMAR